MLGGYVKEPIANERMDQILLSWVMTGALAYLGWRLVEKPGMGLGTRINRAWLGGDAERAA
jgi:peptidoglycan/LPS O-acetylase OafA/YrhL